MTRASENLELPLSDSNIRFPNEPGLSERLLLHHMAPFSIAICLFEDTLIVIRIRRTVEV